MEELLKLGAVQLKQDLYYVSIVSICKSAKYVNNVWKVDTNGKSDAYVSGGTQVFKNDYNIEIVSLHVIHISSNVLYIS